MHMWCDVIRWFYLFLSLSFIYFCYPWTKAKRPSLLLFRVLSFSVILFDFNVLFFKYSILERYSVGTDDPDEQRRKDKKKNNIKSVLCTIHVMFLQHNTFMTKDEGARWFSYISVHFDAESPRDHSRIYVCVLCYCEGKCIIGSFENVAEWNNNHPSYMCVNWVFCENCIESR